MKHVLALSLTIAAAAQAAAEMPVGVYRLVGGPDVASQIELRADGQFAYFLAAGALDEQAQGRWSRKGNMLHLTTEPKPRSAEFRITRQQKAKGTPLHIRVAGPNGDGIAGVDFRIGFNRGEPVEGYTQEYGWSATPDEMRTPTWVELALPMYGLMSPRFTIDSTAGEDLTFTLIRNDIGVIDFQNVPVAIRNRDLIVHRYGGELVYRLDKR